MKIQALPGPFQPSRAGFGGFRARPGIQNPEFRIASEPLSYSYPVLRKSASGPDCSRILAVKTFAVFVFMFFYLFSSRGNLKVGPPARRRPESGRNPDRKPDLRPGSTIA